MRTVACALFFALALAGGANAQDYVLQRAAGAELRTMCGDDHGQLWRADLCGPLIIADPVTRRVWASQADMGGVLRRSGDDWTGALPQGVPVANTTVQWSGVRWVMVMGPLPQDAEQRRVLVAHEAWHRIQDQIGLTAGASDCTHLESERGRYLLRLELRALATALRSRAAARRHAALDALAFRAVRLAEFPRAQGQEAALDRNEGLAAYTGVKLGATEPDFFAARTLDQYDEVQAFARSYAYATGPAYGLLLDDVSPDWREELGPHAPAELLASALNAPRVSLRRLRRTAERYGGPVIASQESTRAAAQATRIAELRRRFGGAGPRTVLPLSRMQMEFDPNAVTPIEGLGTYYETLTVRDAWGEARARQGAVIAQDSRSLYLADPSADRLSGPGWSIRPAPGYVPPPVAPPPPSIRPLPPDPL
jgi:hypothetical protein